MGQFDADDCLARYVDLVRRRPSLYTNPLGDIYEILLEPDRIAHAQAEAARHRRASGIRDDDLRVGVLADDPYVTVTRDAVRFADGSYGLYNRFLVPGGSAVLPLLGDRIVLLNRFRHGTRAWHLEAPRGAFSGIGTPEDEARRELLEEIGADAGELIPLGQFDSMSGISNESHHLYLARIEHIGVPDRHEAIVELAALSVSEMEQKMADSAITDAPTLVLFLRARLHGLL